jgi:hypothetical protein
VDIQEEKTLRRLIPPIRLSGGLCVTGLRAPVITHNSVKSLLQGGLTYNLICTVTDIVVDRGFRLGFCTGSATGWMVMPASSSGYGVRRFCSS